MAIYLFSLIVFLFSLGQVEHLPLLPADESVVEPIFKNTLKAWSSSPVLVADPHPWTN
jgi:hypothetical protein